MRESLRWWQILQSSNFTAFRLCSPEHTNFDRVFHFPIFRLCSVEHNNFDSFHFFDSQAMFGRHTSVDRVLHLLGFSGYVRQNIPILVKVLGLQMFHRAESCLDNTTSSTEPRGLLRPVDGECTPVIFREVGITQAHCYYHRRNSLSSERRYSTVWRSEFRLCSKLAVRSHGVC